jgi:hypothetical protein
MSQIQSYNVSHTCPVILVQSNLFKHVLPSKYGYIRQVVAEYRFNLA